MKLTVSTKPTCVVHTRILLQQNKKLSEILHVLQRKMFNQAITVFYVFHDAVNKNKIVTISFLKKAFMFVRASEYRDDTTCWCTFQW